MAVRLRLRREGTKKKPHFRVVAADHRSPRDGRFIEIIGDYHPMANPSVVNIDEERALHWLKVGARPSSQVENLLRIAGIWEKFRPDDTARPEHPAEEPKKQAPKQEAPAEPAAEAEEAATEEPEEAQAEAAEEPEAAADEAAAADTPEAETDEPEASAEDEGEPGASAEDDDESGTEADTEDDK
ncbi:MAG: 30S ribosomal protein S16 [Nitriliruptorales bacterium]|nr:30S ribosomal protein S16 [Nitriliruptorales bacterium]